MRTFDLEGREGRPIGFQIRSLVGRRRASRVARDVPGARILRWPRRWTWNEDEFCEFEVDGARFVIVEPFGDNSRYWIVSDPPAPAPIVETVRGAFEDALPVDWLFGHGWLTRRSAAE